MPPDASDPEAADSSIASLMTKLSVSDREKVYMDVHGISDYATETPELIVQSLSNLQREIELLPDKRAYKMAERLEPQFVHDTDFRLAFLRCEKFDCRKAALRIIRHFHMKLDLFGEDKLVMDITQDDLDLEEMHALYNGSGRFLNVFDRGGRIINLLTSVPRAYKTEAILRRGFYNAMVACRNEEVPRRGVVSICFHSRSDIRGPCSGDNADLNWKLPKLNEGLPLRLSAVHLCYSQEMWKEQHAIIKTAFNTSVRVRTRVHHGTASECLQQLSGLGIDQSSIPVNENGEVTDEVEHRRGLEEQRKEERLKYSPRNTIGVPFGEDVLLGKGTPFQEHLGNKKLRQMVAGRYKEWEKAPKGSKRAISQEIVDAIKQSGGLFIKQDSNKWVPVENAVAIVKVSANFRTLRLKGEKK